MATRTVKARVELDGEKEYKQALTELNQGNRVLASEMRKLQAEYKGNAESTEFLTQKGDLLDRQLLQQKDKVEKLREALQHAVKTHGEASKEAQQYAVQLNNAEAAQYDLEHAIEENNSALSDIGRQYQTAFDSINSSNRVLASELEKLNAEFRGNSESIEYLTKKGEILAQEFDNSEREIEKLREAVKKASEQFGESSVQTQEWMVKLNQAEAAQYDLVHAIEDNANAALQGEDKTMQGLGDTVSDLAGKLGIKLPEGATKALNGMSSLSAGTVAAMGAAVAAVAALFEAVKKLHQMTLEAAHDVDDLVTKSMTSGVSQQTLQQWKYAENLIDVSVDTMTGSLTRLTRSMADANSDNAELAASFSRLGVSITDGNGELRNATDVFYDVIDALGAMENQTERDAVAMELLGRSAQELNPLIIQGTDALRGLGEEAEATGYVLDESQIKKLGEVDDAYQRLQLTIEANRKQLAAQFAPASKEAMELFSKVVKSAGDTLIQSGLLENTASILTSIMSIFEAAGSLFDALPSWMNPLNMISEALRGLATLLALIADTANVISGVLNPANWGSGMARTALGWNINNGQMSNLQKLQYGSNYSAYGNSYDASTGLYSGNYIGHNASGNYNWHGGPTWLGEGGPEVALLPRGTQILSAQESRKAMGGDTFIFNINPGNIREFQDLLRIAEDARVVARMK